MDRVIDMSNDRMKENVLMAFAPVFFADKEITKADTAALKNGRTLRNYIFEHIRSRKAKNATQ